MILFLLRLRDVPEIKLMIDFCLPGLVEKGEIDMNDSIGHRENNKGNQN